MKFSQISSKSVSLKVMFISFQIILCVTFRVRWEQRATARERVTRTGNSCIIKGNQEVSQLNKNVHSFFALNFACTGQVREASQGVWTD